VERNTVLEYIRMVDQAGTVEEACAMAVEAIAGFTRFSNPSFFLLNPGSDSLELVAHHGFTPGTLSIPRGEGISWRTLEKGETALIEDISKVDDYLPGLEGSCCEINVPVVWRERKIGVFSIESKVSGAFSPDDVHFANLLAAILGSVIVHLETENRLSESLRSLESTARYRSLFLEISMEFYSMTDRGEFLERVVRMLSEVMKYDKVYLFLRQTRNGPLQLRAYSGKDIGEKAIRDVVEGGRGLTGKAIRTGEAVFCNDTGNDPDFYLDDEKTLSEAVLPIRSGDYLWGVLVVDEYERGAFEGEEKEQLRILTGMMGVALDNIDQMMRIREDLDLMERLHGIIASVAGERDIRAMCSETVRLLNVDTKYNFVSIQEIVSEKTGESRVIASRAEEGASGYTLVEQNVLLKKGGWGLVGEAARKRSLLNVPDVRKSELYVPLSDKTRSELDVPIEFDGRIYGILSVESEHLFAFEEKDERVMSILARHLGALWAHNELLERTERQAMQDPLTALWNRRFFFDRLDAETSRCARYGCIFSIVMIDLRNFKIVNDRFGHPAGDRVLIEIASFFQRSLRECDVVARYGGDEFVILFPETDFAEVSRIMERMEENLKNQKLCVESVEVLFDCGIASYPADGKDGRALVQVADERLYSGKNAAKKNCKGGSR